MRKRLAAAAAIFAFLSSCAAADRGASGHLVVSRRDPVVSIRLPEAARYVGSDRFLLRDPKLGAFDRCQLFAFAEGDKASPTLYWVQFEEYLPSHPELHHTYDSPRHAALGGLDFYVDTWITPGTDKPEAGSDSEHFYTLLARHGIQHRDAMTVRFVHLTDATKRKELMIIYREPLPAGETAAALAKGGADHAKWPEIEKGLIARGEKSVEIARTPN